MQLTRTEHAIDAEHGVIVADPDSFYGYYGWPTVARLPDGTLVAAASGLRNAHVCPFGRSTFFRSDDEGRSWTAPRVVQDSPLDDRDTGLVACGDKRLLLTWFTSDHRAQAEQRLAGRDAATRTRWEEGLRRVSDANAAEWVGAWCRTSPDAGEHWSEPIRLPQTTPHGPIQRRGGDLLFFGKLFHADLAGFEAGHIVATRSADLGRTWEPLGAVPLMPGTRAGSYHEAHVAELPDGRLVGLIRFSGLAEESPDIEQFSMLQTRSEDGGVTWSPPEPMQFHGSPPHLLVHSSGTLIATYGRRREPYGQRIMVSVDGGDSWDYDYLLRGDGPDTDLGYPSTVELTDGSLLTAYYQKPSRSIDKCGLLTSRWSLSGLNALS